MSEVNVEVTEENTEAVEVPAEAEAVEVEAQTEQVEEAVEGDEQEAAPETVEEPFPNKAKNAIARRNRKIAKQAAEIRRLTEQANSAPQAKPSNEVPNMDDFETYDEYVLAMQNHNMDTKFAERDKRQAEARQAEQDQQWQAERQASVAEQAQKMIEEFPDYQEVLAENGDIIDDFSPELQQLFLEADNAPLAFYSMAKNGTLDSLLDMTPMQAAMAVGRAISAAPTAPQPVKPVSKVSKAPKPMRGVSGTGENSNNPVDMDPEKLMAWINS